MKKASNPLPEGIKKLKLSPHTAVVYEYLYKHTEMGESARLPKTQIAKDSKLSVQRVAQAIDELFLVGLLKDVSFTKKIKQVLLCIPTKDGRRDSVSGLPLKSDLSKLNKEQVFKDCKALLRGFSAKQQEQAKTWMVEMLVSVIYLTRYSQAEEVTEYAKLLKRKNKWGNTVSKEVLLKVKVESLAFDALLQLYIDEIVWKTRSMVDVYHMAAMLLETFTDIRSKTFKG